MYAGVPAMARCGARAALAAIRCDRPKSSSFTVPSRVRKTLPGLRSRCTQAPLVRVRQPRADALENLQRPPHLHPPPLQQRGERLSLQALHHQEGHARLLRNALPLGHVEDADDVLLVQPRHRPRFGQGLRLEARTRQQELERHLAPQRLVSRAEHLAHPPAPHPLAHLVPPSVRSPEHLPGQRQHGNGSDCPSSRRKESSKSEAPERPHAHAWAAPPCSPSCVASLLIPCSGGAAASSSGRGPLCGLNPGARDVTQGRMTPARLTAGEPRQQRPRLREVDRVHARLEPAEDSLQEPPRHLRPPRVPQQPAQAHRRAQLQEEGPLLASDSDGPEEVHPALRAPCPPARSSSPRSRCSSASKLRSPVSRASPRRLVHRHQALARAGPASSGPPRACRGW